MAEIVFWFSAFWVGYAYFAYPLLLTIWARFRVAPYAHSGNEQVTPSVSIIIPAYNEESVIEKKLENTAGILYERGKAVYTPCSYR